MDAHPLIAASTRIRRSPEAVFRPLQAGEGGVALHLESGQYYGLNETGVLIWTLLHEEPRFADLVGELRSQLVDVPVTIDKDVAAFLQELSERSLIEVIVQI
jgi:hypothetical protein